MSNYIIEIKFNFNEIDDSFIFIFLEIFNEIKIWYEYIEKFKNLNH